jgi:hypothetical protein
VELLDEKSKAENFELTELEHLDVLSPLKMLKVQRNKKKKASTYELEHNFKEDFWSACAKESKQDFGYQMYWWMFRVTEHPKIPGFQNLYIKLRTCLSSICKTWAFQLEKGELTGKLHYQ